MAAIANNAITSHSAPSASSAAGGIPFLPRGGPVLESAFFKAHAIFQRIGTSRASSSIKGAMEVFSDPRAEEGLIRAAAGGDSAAFETLFHRYYDMIHAYAYRMCYDAAEAADLTQETWIKVARNLSLYRGKASFKNWIHSVAHNVVFDALRRKARQRRLLDLARQELSPEPALSPADESDSLKRALLSLSPELRSAVALVYFDGKTHAEAATILNCAEATVSWRLFQARRKLKKLLDREAGR